MNKTQKKRFDMYLAVRDYLLKNGELTKSLPNFEGNFNELQGIITRIQQISEVQKTDSAGFAAGKKKLKEKLIVLVLDNSYKLQTFADMGGDIKLTSQVKITKSQLLQSNLAGLKDYAQLIYDKGEENIGNLSQYGITKETQVEFLDYINKYNLALSGPRVAVADGVTVTELLITLYENADVLINSITSVIGLIRLSEPVFVKGFESARRVMASNASPLSLRATAVDSRTGQGIKGVKFILQREILNLAEGEPEEIIKKTAGKGFFWIRNMKEGTYNVTVIRQGYKNKSVSVVIADGKLTNLKVEMEAA
jgi:hypothetical protein